MAETGPKQAEIAANHDHLTGLSDRALFMSNLESSIIRSPGDFGVLFIDFDGLKAANDSGGHKAGDELLRRGADLLMAEFRLDSTNRQPDVVSRIGGDEIGVIVHGISALPILQEVTQRVQTNLDSQDVPISVGAALHNPGESPSEILSRADAAMYKNKVSRRLGKLSADQLQAIAVIDEITKAYDLDIRTVAAVVETFRRSRE